MLNNLPFSVSIFIVAFSSFTSVLILTPFLIKKLEIAGFISKDMSKGGRKIAKNAGISILFGLSLGILISLKFIDPANIVHMLAALCTILLITIIGILDDFVPIADRWRVVLPLFAAIPLMITRAGVSSMNFPFFGDIELGLIYSLILVPIGVIACSNLVNLLAGFNGLEAGIGFVSSVCLFFTSLIVGSNISSMIFMSLAAACLAFLFYNWYPAKAFPGNVTTYLIGATIASGVITGNIEKAGIIALIPQIIEFFLKATSKFQAENFPTRIENGHLIYEGKIYSLTHIIQKYLRPTEVELVLLLLLIQLLFGILAIISVL